MPEFGTRRARAVTAGHLGSPPYTLDAAGLERLTLHCGVAYAAVAADPTAPTVSSEPHLSLMVRDVLAIVPDLVAALRSTRADAALLAETVVRLTGGGAR